MTAEELFESLRILASDNPMLSNSLPSTPTQRYGSIVTFLLGVDRWIKMAEEVLLSTGDTGLRTAIEPMKKLASNLPKALAALASVTPTSAPSMSTMRKPELLSGSTSEDSFTSCKDALVAANTEFSTNWEQATGIGEKMDAAKDWAESYSNAIGDCLDNLPM